MKVNVLILLPIFVAHCCLGLTDEGRQFKGLLGLSDFNGPTNRFTWACPSSVTVSNQTFKIDVVDQSECYFHFGLTRQDGMGMAGCSVGIAPSAEEAVNAICDRIVVGGTFFLKSVAATCRVSRDAQGNVLLERCKKNKGNEIVMNHSNFYRTYGNLVINIGVNTNRVSLTAKDFALPLLLEGLSFR